MNLSETSKCLKYNRNYEYKFEEMSITFQMDHFLTEFITEALNCLSKWLGYLSREYNYNIQKSPKRRPNM